MPIMLKGIEGIESHVGFSLGKSAWLQVSQEMVDNFASETDDHRWIHVDQEKSRQGPFGGPVAQACLTLNLVVGMLKDVYILEDVGVDLHYGIDQMRFLHPVPVNSSIRLEVTLASVQARDEDIEMTLACTVECDAYRTPVMQGDIIYRFWPEQTTIVKAALQACAR